MNKSLFFFVFLILISIITPWYSLEVYSPKYDKKFIVIASLVHVQLTGEKFIKLYIPEVQPIYALINLLPVIIIIELAVFWDKISDRKKAAFFIISGLILLFNLGYFLDYWIRSFRKRNLISPVGHFVFRDYVFRGDWTIGVYLQAICVVLLLAIGIYYMIKLFIVTAKAIAKEED